MMGHTRSYRWPLAVLVLLVVAGSARQSHAFKVTIAKVDVGRYQMMLVSPEETVPHGAVRRLKLPEGKSFLALWLLVDVVKETTDKEDDNYEVEEEMIRLVYDDGDEWAAVGRCTRDGRFYPHASGFYHYGDSEKHWINLTFVVPDDKNQFTLKFGTLTAKVAAPKQIKPRFTIDEAGEFTITSVQPIEKLSTELTLGDFDKPVGDFQVELATAARRFVSVTITAKGKVPTDEDGDFEFLTEQVGLLYGGKVYVSPVGQIDSGSFSVGSYSEYAESNAGGYLPVQATLVFPLPSGITNFRVLYMTHPIGMGKLPE